MLSSAGRAVVALTGSTVLAPAFLAESVGLLDCVDLNIYRCAPGSTDLVFMVSISVDTEWKPIKKTGKL